ncbi:hypothetical protein VNO77_21909 [Canavalia gladiata]|uniref:GB1/RHD3-type G domain-containing protein n=1 Tax=Canavalia gladiata TaxID=3824 RepID=A0AAN9L6T4_CANGL
MLGDRFTASLGGGKIMNIAEPGSTPNACKQQGQGKLGIDTSHTSIEDMFYAKKLNVVERSILSFVRGLRPLGIGRCTRTWILSSIGEVQFQRERSKMTSGFQVASTHQPCTKGLWLWSAPLKRTALDGTEYNLLLLDSEGIDAYD